MACVWTACAYLVVEDDRECRELLQVILENAGARVTSASSVRDAMDTVTTCEPDVLVSDIGMPGEDGFALIRKIRNLDGAIAKIPALALTGYEQTAGSDAVRPERFQQIAVKPIDPQRARDHRRETRVENLKDDTRGPDPGTDPGTRNTALTSLTSVPRPTGRLSPRSMPANSVVPQRYATSTLRANRGTLANVSSVPPKA